MTDSKNELEVKVAFLEENISQLSDEFYRQQKELFFLKEQYQLVLEKLKRLQHGGDELPDYIDEKPPHY